VKKLFDLTLAIFLLLALSPLGAAIALCIILDSKGPVFYKSRRIGLKGAEFVMWKFRTMFVDSHKFLNQQEIDEFQRSFKLKSDPRITQVGKSLRMLSLDEIPQLWNILKGEMSFVGPRPKLPEEIYLYGDNKSKLLSVKPGLTGYWQVHRKTTASDETMRAMDLYYVDNYSLLGDISLLFKTFRIMCKSSNN